MAGSRVNISYVPDPRTLFSGKSHFSRVSDAVAEFVDNSIQACSSNKESRNIHVSVDLNIYGESPSFITIVDDGQGMTAGDIQTFATYAWAQEARGPTSASTSSTSSISKFGVGAKEAGFYLGDRIHVLSKPSCGSAETAGKLLDFAMDEKLIKSRADATRQNAEAYVDDVHITPLGTESVLWLSDEYPARLLEMKRRLESDEYSFTMIIIRLHPSICSHLQRKSIQKVKELPFQLAEIYHFHLHSEDLPDGAYNRMHETALERFRGKREIEHRLREFNYSSCGKQQTVHHVTTPLDILYEAIVNSEVLIEKRSLRDDIEDSTRSYFDMAQGCIRFNMVIPDPKDENQFEDMSGEARDLVARPNREWTSRHTGSRVNKKTIQGLLLYFPCVNGAETRPSDDLVREFDDQGVDRAVLDLTSDNETSTKKNIVFRIYWQNRLVPETVVDKLSFFPLANTLVQCNSLQIPPAWRNRLKGFLFIDGRFDYISNNKLKIAVDPNFNDWLNAKDTLPYIDYTPRTMKNLFPRWLKFCHEVYDQEFLYRGNMSNSAFLDMARNVLSNSTTYCRTMELRGLEVYDTLCYQQGPGQQIVAVGEEVKLTLPTKGKRKGQLVMVQVLGFICLGHSVDSSEEAQGHGLVWYAQIPTEIFGSVEEPRHHRVVPVTAIDFTTAFRVTEEELDVMRSSAVSNVFVKYRLDGETDDGHKLGKNVLKLAAGEKLEDIVVEIRNARKELVVGPPAVSSRAKSTYCVKLSCPEIKKSFGVAKKPCIKRTLPDGVFYEEAATLQGAGYFRFPNISWKKSGDFTLFVEVLDGDRILLQKERKIEVTGGSVTHFEVRGDFSTHVYLGSCLPPFTVKCLDKFGNDTFPKEEENRVELVAEGLSVGYLDISGEVYPDVLFGPGELDFGDNQWQVFPSPDISHAFISDEEVTTKQVKFEVRLAGLDISRHFTVMIKPGYPTRLTIVEPAAHTISVPNGETIPAITVACFDDWGNRTGPTGRSKWMVDLSPDGPIVCGESFPVLADGTAILDRMYVDADEMGVLTHVAVLDWSPPGDIQLSQDQGPISTLITLNVLPGRKPEYIEVLHKGEPIPDTWECPAGEEIGSLSVRVITENGEEWDCAGQSFSVHPDWVRGGGSSTTPRKKSKKGKRKGDAGDGDVGGKQSLDLPPIQLPAQIEQVPLMFNVHCSIDGASLSCQFNVYPTADAPVRWNIMTASDSAGIMCNNPEDFAAKILGVWPTDSNGNEVEESSFTCMPELVIHFSYTFEEDEIVRVGPVSDGAVSSVDTVERQPVSVAQLSQQARQESKLPYVIPLVRDDEERPLLGAHGNALASPRSCQQAAARSSQQLLIQSNRKSMQIRARFVPIPGSKISSLLTSVPVYITARDPARSLEPATTEFLVVGGLPKRIYLRSDTQGEFSEGTDIITRPLHFTSMSRLEIEMQFVDEYGHDCYMKNVKNVDIKVIYELRYKLDEEDTEDEVSEVILFSKKSLKDGMTKASLNFGKVYNEIKSKCGPAEDGYEVALMASASYTIDGIKRALVPAQIPCIYKKLNIITDIIPSLELRRYADDMMNRLTFSSTHTLFPENTVTCGQEFFIHLEVLTEDGVLPDITPGDIDVTIKRGGSGSAGDGVDVNDFKGSAILGEDGIITYGPIELRRSGNYKFSFRYNESRPKLTDNKMLPDSTLKVKNGIDIECLAGVGTEIVPTEQTRRSLTGLCVTNSRHSSPDDRLIGKNLDFLLKDCFGNNATFSEKSVLVCSVHCPQRFVASDNLPLPRLLNTPTSEVQGQFPDCVVGIRATQDMFRFLNISLTPCDDLADTSSVVLDGSMNLAFTLHHTCKMERELVVGSSCDASIDVKSWGCTFVFTSDRGRAQKKRLFNEEVQPYMDRLEVLRDKQRGLEAEVRSKYDSINKQLVGAPEEGVVASLFSAPSQWDYSDADIHRLEQQRIELEKQLQDRQTSRKAVRQALKPAGRELQIPASVPAGAIFGQVVDIGFVKDPHLASIMSWAAQDYMSTVVVSLAEMWRNARQELRVLNGDLRIWSLDRIRPFRNGDSLRTSTDMDTQQLPLPPIVLPSKSSALQGNPKHMVNLIELNRSQEALRGTVFYNIYREMILMDTDKAAHEYWSSLMNLPDHLASQVSQMPTIYTLEGTRILSDGSVQLMKDNLGSVELEYEFGQRDPLDLDDYRIIEKDLAVIKAVLHLLADRNDLHEKLSEKNSEIDQVETIIRAAEVHHEISADTVPASSLMVPASSLMYCSTSTVDSVIGNDRSKGRDKNGDGCYSGKRPGKRHALEEWNDEGDEDDELLLSLPGDSNRRNVKRPRARK